MSIEAICLFTHEYAWTLKPFLTLFEKYWPGQSVTFWGDRDPGGVRFRRVPCYTEGEWPWNHWFGNGLRSILDDIRASIVAIFLPDHWLSEPVDVEGIRKLRNWMDFRGDILRGNLTRAGCLDAHGTCVAFLDNSHEIVTVPPTDVHCGLMGGLTFSPALWNRALLRDVLEPRWSLHECERAGTDRFARLWYPEIYCVGTRPGLLSRAHGLSRARPNVASLEGLGGEDREMVKSALPEGWGWIN